MTDLFPTWTLGALGLTSYPFAVEFDGDHGAPETISELVTTMLADGDLVRQTRHGNREISIVVVVEGATLGLLAENEATLRAECSKPGNLLTFQPGDVDSPSSVFEVLLVQMRQPRNDTHEAHLMRRWELTLTCAPFARSEDLVTVPALPVPAASPTTQVLNDALSTAGWSATATRFSRAIGGFETFSVAVTGGGGDGVAVTTTAATLALTCTLAAPVVLVGTRYLVVEVAGGPVTTISVHRGGAGLLPVPVLMTRATPLGTVQHVVDLGVSATVSAFRLSWAEASGLNSVPVALVAYSATATDTLPQVTSRQVSRVIDTGGTERTPATVTVASRGGEALDFTIVHTSPENLVGYAPPLRRWRVNGNTVTGDDSLISGARERVALTAIEAQVPLASLPTGEYVLAALMRSDTAGTFPITWTANSLIPGYGFLGPAVSDVAQAEFLDPGFWTLVPLGVVTLPPVRATDTLAVVQLTLNRGVVASEIIDVDEWWAFRIGDDSALTIVGNPVSRLWLDSPDANRSVPQVWVGDFDNRADARHPGAGLYAFGSHVLHPAGTSIFVATGGAEHPSVSATYYKRWHSNAAG